MAKELKSPSFLLTFCSTENFSFLELTQDANLLEQWQNPQFRIFFTNNEFFCIEAKLILSPRIFFFLLLLFIARRISWPTLLAEIEYNICSVQVTMESKQLCPVYIAQPLKLFQWYLSITMRYQDNKHHFADL